MIKMMPSAADWTEEDEREHEAAMQAARDEARSETNIEEQAKENMKFLLQQRHDRLTKERRLSRFGRRIYHNAPNDVLELIVTKFSNRYSWGDYLGRNGGMNVLRLVGKRMKQVVESCATKLTNMKEDGPDSLPLDLLVRCRRIDCIWCSSHNLRSLDGCPHRLKSLHIDCGRHIQSLEPLRGCTELEELTMDGSLVSALSPLAECTRMKELDIEGSLITDISILSLMPLLESVKFYKEPGDPSITDLSPLLQCQKIRVLHVCGNIDLKDLTVLSNFSTLRTLDITETQIQDLTPLAGLPKLSCLFCTHIPTNTSLLPLERCNKLREIHCHDNAKDLDLLQQRRPDIMFHTARPSFALGAPAMIHLIGVVQSRIHAMTVAQAANPALLGVPAIQALVAIGPQLQDFVDQLQAQVSMIGLAPQSHALLQQIQLIEAQFQAYFADEQAQQQLLEAEAQGQGQAQAQEAEQNENQGEQHEEQLQGELEKLTLFRH